MSDFSGRSVEKRKKLTGRARWSLRQNNIILYTYFFQTVGGAVERPRGGRRGVHQVVGDGVRGGGPGNVDGRLPGNAGRPDGDHRQRGDHQGGRRGTKPLAVVHGGDGGLCAGGAAVSCAVHAGRAVSATGS